MVHDPYSLTLLSVHSILGLVLWLGGHFPWGKGFGGSGLLLLPKRFFEVILEVVLKGKQAVEALSPDQGGLALSGKVIIHSGKKSVSLVF